MSGPAPADERARFEKAMQGASVWCDPSRDQDGDYTNVGMRHAWLGWQAAAQTRAGDGKRIRTRCPACGRAELFIGDGGWLTCSAIECQDPTRLNSATPPPEAPMGGE